MLSDGTYRGDGGAFFGVVPKVLWEKRIQADDRNTIQVGLNSLLVRGGEKTVLVETGIGPKLNQKSRAIYQHEPQLMESFRHAGVLPEEIDIVINTHLHFDHCGWNTQYSYGKAVATFPKATYYAQRGELEHAHEQNERDRVSYLTDNYDPLVRSGQMVLLDGDAEIAPGISVKVYPGHTQNLQAVIIRSGGATLCYPSDLVPTTHHLDPTWVMAYDLFPLTCIASRHRLYNEAIPGKWIMAFTHDHEVPLASVDVGEKGKPVAKLPG